MKITRKITWIVAAIIVLTLCNILLVNHSSLSLCCTLFLLQNILLPAISTSYLIDASKQQNCFSAVIGAIISLAPTTSMILASAAGYYFRGEKQRLEDIARKTLPETTEIIIAGIVAYVFVWMALMMVSSISGFIAAYIKAKRPGAI